MTDKKEWRIRRERDDEIVAHGRDDKDIEATQALLTSAEEYVLETSTDGGDWKASRKEVQPGA